MRPLRSCLISASVVLISVLGFACFDSCQPPFPPGNHIDKFRVLAIKAEPPEIGQGERAEMTFLAVDEKGLLSAQQSFRVSSCFNSKGLSDPSAVWVACLPGVGAKKQPSAGCTDLGALTGGGSDGGSPGLPDGGQSFQILFPPCGAKASWSSPKDYLSPLPAQEQAKGADAIIVLATTRDKLRQISIKSLKISTKPESERNTNPQLLGIQINDKEVSTCRGEDKDKCMVQAFPINKELTFTVTLSKDSQDPLPPEKDKKPRREDITIEWFATDGEFDTRRSVVSGEDPPRNSPWPHWNPVDFTGKVLPQGREIQIVAIARDSRGGTDWISCRIQLAAPGAN